MSKINLPIPDLKQNSHTDQFHILSKEKEDDGAPDIGKIVWIVRIGELPDEHNVYSVDYPEPFQATIKNLRYGRGGYFEGVIATHGINNKETNFFFPEDLFGTEEKAQKFIDSDRKKQINKRLDSLKLQIPQKQKELDDLRKELSHLNKIADQLVIAGLSKPKVYKTFPDDFIEYIHV